MKTKHFIEEMQKLGYKVWRPINPMRIDIMQRGEYKTIAKIDKWEAHRLDTTLDTEGLLSEDAIRLCFLYAQTPVEEREADYYRLKTEHDLTGRNDYVYTLYNYNGDKTRITFVRDRKYAKIFTRREAIEIANEYSFLELEEVTDEN